MTLHGSPITFGLISACFGAGALLRRARFGSGRQVHLARDAHRRRGLRRLRAPDRTAAERLAIGALLFACGIFFTSYTSNSNARVQLESPDYIRGRVLGLYYYAWNGLAPLGSLLVGWLFDVGGTELAFFVAGASALAVTAFGAAAVKRPRRLRPVPLKAEPVGEQLAA